MSKRAHIVHAKPAMATELFRSFLHAFAWQVLGALDYEFCRSKSVTWSRMIGYKALSADYSQGSGLNHYEYDLTMHGPIFGVTARF